MEPANPEGYQNFISDMGNLPSDKHTIDRINFEPGLVGGHCIGVDPYYLAYKAEEVGHHPQIIMAGRRINDAMGRYYARDLIKKMSQRNLNIANSSILVLGITFKENVPDIRNSRVIDIVRELEDFGFKVDVYDPVADPSEVLEEYGIRLIKSVECKKVYGAVVLAVKHDEFLKNSYHYTRRIPSTGIFYDIKEALP